MPNLKANPSEENTEKLAELEAKLKKAAGKQNLKRIPFIDDFDIRYNLTVKEPSPSSKAVMFCSNGCIWLDESSHQRYGQAIFYSAVLFSCKEITIIPKLFLFDITLMQKKLMKRSFSIPVKPAALLFPAH